MAKKTIYGSFSGVSTSNVRPAIEVSSTTNTGGNYSDVTAILVFYRYNTSWRSWNGYGHSVTFKLDGNSSRQSKTFDIRGTSREVVWTRTRRVYHNSNGSKSISVSASGSTGVSLGSYNFSGTVTLDTIPRKSKLTSASLSYLRDGHSARLDIGRTVYYSGFYHLVSIYDGNDWIWDTNYFKGNPDTTYYLASDKVEDMLRRMKTQTKKTFKVRLRTFTRSGGSGFIGHSDENITVSVDSNVKPSISAASIDEDVANIKTDLGVYVQYKSKLKLGLSGSAGYGASIKSYKITANGQTFNSNSGTTTTLKNSGTNTITFEITDSRGRKSSTTRTVTVYQYSNPEPRITDIYRSDADGTPNDDGEYGTVEYTSTVSSLNGHNTETCQVRYKRSDDTYFTEETVAGSGGYTFLANVDYSYDVQLVTSDYFTSVPAYADILPTFSLMNFAEDGKALAFGGAYSDSLGGIAQFIGDIYNDGLRLGSKVLDYKSSVDGGEHEVLIPERGLYFVIVAPSSSDPTVGLINVWSNSNIHKATLSAGNANAEIITSAGKVTIKYTTWFHYAVIKLT